MHHEPSASGNPPAFVTSTLTDHELRHLQKEWWWLAGLGVLMIASGTLAIVYPAVSSVAAVIVLGMSLLVSGVASIVASFWGGRWSAHLLQLLFGVLYVVVGFIIMDRPVVATLNLTLFVAAIFLVVGILRSFAALTIRYPQWGWALLSGLITALLGLVIYKSLDDKQELWAIGTLIGIELIFGGWFWLMLGVAIWKLPTQRA